MLLRCARCELAMRWRVRTVLLQQRQDDRPSSDERLLVGERDRAAKLDRLNRRQQPLESTHGARRRLATHPSRP
eukprot:857739-Pleurochrysis_carterae.AAC.1